MTTTGKSLLVCRKVRKSSPAVTAPSAATSKTARKSKKASLLPTRPRTKRRRKSECQQPDMERMREHSFSFILHSFSVGRWGRTIKDDGEPLSRMAHPEFSNQLSDFGSRDLTPCLSFYCKKSPAATRWVPKQSTPCARFHSRSNAVSTSLLWGPPVQENRPS